MTTPVRSGVARRLPEHADLSQLRRQARDLQRAVRAGRPEALARSGLGAADPAFALHAAQLVLAREYGFPSWPRLQRQVTAIAARTWNAAEPEPDEPWTLQLLRLACLDYGTDEPSRPQAAAELLARHDVEADLHPGSGGRDPSAVATELAVAAVCGRPQLVAALLRDDRRAAVTSCGPHGWPPLFYLAYGRLEATGNGAAAGSTETPAAALECARLLLAAGADPNDGRFFSGLPTPFTTLTGVLGGGERDQPPHRHAIALAELLLRAGADPNDAQTLYNRQFEPEDDWLRLLIGYGLGRPSAGPWATLLPDLTDSPADLLRGLLVWAVLHDQRDRARLLAEAGVDLAAPLSSPFLPRRSSGEGYTPVELALVSGHRALARQLQRAGAGEPNLSPAEAVIVAVMTADHERLSTVEEPVRRQAREAWPGLVVWAASQGGPDAVSAAVGAGFGIDALGRSDVPLQQPWQTALHTAVERNDPRLVTVLLDLGADPGIVDARFRATAAGWADHFGRPALAGLLSRAAGR